MYRRMRCQCSCCMNLRCEHMASHVRVLTWIPLCTLRWPDSTNYKSLDTITTFKRFQSTVNSALLNQMSWLCKSFATNSTLKRFLSTVSSDVYFKATGRNKSFATNRTYKRFLSTMNIVVGNKLNWLWKLFATISTFKWFHSAMTSPVYCHLCTTFYSILPHSVHLYLPV